MRAIFLVGLAALLGLSCAPTISEAEISARSAIAELLDSKVICDTKGNPADMVIQFILDEARINMILDCNPPEADVVIDLDLGGREVSDALRLVCEKSGLDYCVTAGVLYVSTAERVVIARRGPPRLQISDPAQRQRLERTLSFCFPGNTATQQMVNFFQAISNLDIRMRPDDPDGERVMEALVIVDDVSLLHAIYWIAVVSDMELKAEGGAIVLVPRKKLGK